MYLGYYFFSYYSFFSHNILYSASKQHLGWRAHAPTVPTMPQLSPPRWNSARALPRRQSTSNSRTPAPPRRQARLGSHTRIAWNRWTPCTARATITGVPHASHDQIPGRLPSALGTSPRGRRAMDHHRRGRRLVRSLGQWCGARVTCRGFPFQSCSRRQRRCSSLCFARVQRHYSKARRTGVRTRRWRAGWRHDSATSYSYRSPLTPCRHRRFAAIVVAWPRQTDLVASRPRIWGMATYGACGLAGDVDRPPPSRDSEDARLSTLAAPILSGARSVGFPVVFGECGLVLERETRRDGEGSRRVLGRHSSNDFLVEWQPRCCGGWLLWSADRPTPPQ